jgi:hypothetical protein
MGKMMNVHQSTMTADMTEAERKSELETAICAMRKSADAHRTLTYLFTGESAGRKLSRRELAVIEHGADDVVNRALELSRLFYGRDVGLGTMLLP